MAMSVLTDGYYTHARWTGLVVKVEGDVVTKIMRRPFPLRYWMDVEQSWIGYHVNADSLFYFKPVGFVVPKP